MSEDQKFQRFPWESAVPKGKFWDKLDDNYKHISRQFLKVFTVDEVTALPLDPSLSQAEMREQLYAVAKAELAARPVLAAEAPEALPRDQWLQWSSADNLLACLEGETNRYQAVEDRYVRQLDVWKKRYELGIDPEIKGPVNLLARSNLTWWYLQGGKPAEAEQMARGMPELLRANPMLGPGPSPQELGSRRALMEALAKQGKYDEAKRLNDEGYAVIAELAEGKFAKYNDEEIEAMNEVRDNLKAWSAVAVA
ncbi:hypothetical protein GQ53DRAFT_743881 [Thozetella sp. PMI_491]|nr:hypothetical protein GQ53DRAFT_743881 [Thozetella sp. PMI_491]